MDKSWQTERKRGLLKENKIRNYSRILGGIIYLCGLFGGYIPLLMLLGYVVLIESNDWLKYVAVKALCINIFFSVLIVIVGFIPDILGILQNLVRLFNGSFTYAFIINLESLLVSILNFIKIIILLMLAMKAVSLRDVKIFYIDQLINKYIN